MSGDQQQRPDVSEETADTLPDVLSDTVPDTRQGPMEPRGPGGADAQPPPGNPLRTDTPAAVVAPVAAVPDPGPQVQRVTRPEGPATTPDGPGGPDETPGPREQGAAERALQAENAGTTMDQPSQ